MRKALGGVVELGGAEDRDGAGVGIESLSKIGNGVGFGDGVIGVGT